MIIKPRLKIFQTKIYCLGVIGCEDEIFVNHILLLVKHYLYSCRQNKYPPSIRVLHSKINTVFLIETMIAKSNNKGLFTWSGGPRSSGVGVFCFHALGDTKQKKLTPLGRGPPLHVNKV